MSYTKDRAPTAAEIAAHAAAHPDADGDGLWMYYVRGALPSFQYMGPTVTATPASAGTHWTPLSADRRPVPWPGEVEGLEVVILIGVAPDGSWVGYGDSSEASESTAQDIVAVGLDWHADIQLRRVRAMVPAYAVPEVHGEVTDG